MPYARVGPLCRYCAEPIAKRTIKVHVVAARTGFNKDSAFWRYVEVGGNFPLNWAECEKLTNQQVIAVRYADSGGATARPHVIDWFTEWDGQSYVDPYFCNGDHAQLFGRALARVGLGSTKYFAAVREQQGKTAA
jgi:hypothetical protein